MRTTEFSIDGVDLSPEELKRAVGGCKTGCKTSHRRRDDAQTVSRIVDLLFKNPAAASTAAAGAATAAAASPATAAAPSSAFSVDGIDAGATELAPGGF